MANRYPDLRTFERPDLEIHRDRPHSIELVRPRDGGKPYWTIKAYTENLSSVDVLQIKAIDLMMQEQFWGERK